MASGILLVAHVILCSFDNPRRDTTEEVLVAVNEESRWNRFRRKIIQHTHNHGGTVIFGFKIARLIGYLSLFALSLATLLLRSVDSTHPERMWDWDKKNLLDNLSQIAMSATFVSRYYYRKYTMLITRRKVLYLIPCYNFSRSKHMEPIRDASQQLCFLCSTCCLRLS